MTRNSFDMLYQTSHDKRAWVVFTNQTDLPYLRLLRKGYKHCFVLIHDGKNWLSIDPLAGYMEVAVHDLPDHFDLPVWLRGQGHKVIAAPMAQEMKTTAPFTLLTCVEVCKRILGIHNRLILTPWQLYKHLQPETNRRRVNNSFRKGEISWEV